MLRSILDRIFSDRRSPQSRKRAKSLDNRRRLFLETLENRALMAALTTDALDYAPASTAYLTASDFSFGAAITFQVVHEDGLEGGAGHEPWTVIDGSEDDLDPVDGVVTTAWYVNPDDSDGATFLATATDGTQTASTTFTDAAPVLSSTTAVWTGNGTTDGYCDTHVIDDPVLNPEPGQQGWLFVMSKPFDDNAGSDLTATFSDGSQGPIAGTQKGDGSFHYIVYTAAGAQLLSASATNGTLSTNAQNGNSDVQSVLTVSHCEDGGDDNNNKLDAILIGGFKFEDTNGDADLTGDSPIAWTQINFDDNTTAPSLATTSATAANGYSFRIVASSTDNGLTWSFAVDTNKDDVDLNNDGVYENTIDDVALDANTTYHVYETADPAWTPTYGIGGYTVSLNSATGVVTTSAEFGPDTLNFGNFENIDISGTKYEDHNGNGEQNIGDGPLGDFVFILNDNGNGVPDVGERTTTSDDDGTWSFDNVGPGAWKVTEAYAGDWVLIQGEGGYTGVAASGDDVTSGLTFGNFEKIDISGVKFLDHTGDGHLIKDTTNDYRGGFTIVLYVDSTTSGTPGELDASDTLVTSTTTLVDGSYSFTDLGPGTYFVVENALTQSDPANWIQTGGGNDGNNYYTEVASSGENVESDNFANVHIGSHGGLTIGFYSNKNGQTLLTGSSTGTTVKGPIATYLKSVLANSAIPGSSVLVLGTTYLTLAELGSYTKLRNVMLQATATNMANMLSAQLLATVLNSGFAAGVTCLINTGISTSESIYLPSMTRLSGKSNATVQGWLRAGGINTSINPGVKTSAGDNYVTIQELICAAVKELKTNKNTTATSKDRNFQEALKSSFDGINNGDPIFVL